MLPQSVAFATIAGLPPEYGLYTAMVTPIVAALFGSSLHLISGPTTAISIVIFSTVSLHAVPGSDEFIKIALTMTFLAGVYQFTFGLVRLGALVNFGSLNFIQTRLNEITDSERINHILIIGTGIDFIDLSGEEMLLSEAHRLEKLGGGLYFADLKPNVYEFLGRAHFISDVGNAHFFDRKKYALRYLYQKLDRQICEECTARLFTECKDY